MLCHRFYMRQSHAKNDWQTIATASMFLACKIEETPRLLRDVVVMAYKMIYKWDPSAPQRIRRIEFCDKQKELITTAERLLLATIAFDFDIQLPYKPLVDALMKLQICPDLARVAWNFVNDWLCTTVCLQYKPHYIAAGSLFLAAKLQKVKLPTEKGKIWWQQFDISPKQLEEVIQEMVRLLEQDKKQAPPPMHEMSTRSRTSVGKTITSSAQSAVSSVSNASLHSTGRAIKESQVLGKRNIGMKKDLPSQTSESGAVSSIDDGDGENQPDLNSSCNNSSSKIDADRIREALKRRRCERASSKKSGETMNAEVGSEAWIERKLEDGIELVSAASSDKRQRKL
ncbi:cyclin-T1-3 isoform X2 [Jatropha curcas]|nr:cyclin-T1-3 isoform X2 [Jatropha curcas]